MLWFESEKNDKELFIPCSPYINLKIAVVMPIMATTDETTFNNNWWNTSQRTVEVRMSHRKWYQLGGLFLKLCWRVSVMERKSMKTISRLDVEETIHPSIHLPPCTSLSRCIPRLALVSIKLSKKRNKILGVCCSFLELRKKV